jgi:hypothetical protein
MKKKSKILALSVIILLSLTIATVYLLNINNENNGNRDNLIGNGKLYFSYDRVNNSLLVVESYNVFYENFLFQKSGLSNKYYVKENMTIGEGKNNTKHGSIEIGDRITLFENIEKYTLYIIFEPTNSMCCTKNINFE